MPSNTESAAGGGGTSTTTVSVDTVTGFHVLKVEGYSQFKGLGVGKRVKSGTFAVGGHSWCISFFPDGYNDESADWICVDLYLDHTTPASGDVVKARFTLSLPDQIGEQRPSHKASALTTFSSTQKSHGFREFIKRKDLESSSFLREDSFRIRCDVSVVRDIVAKVTESLIVPPPDLQRHLGELLDSKVGGDVTFEVGGELFMAHRYVLAAWSSVFMAELFGSSMKEKLSDRVRIDDMEARVFKIMLRFIYTDSLPDIDADEKTAVAQHLLVAADRYNLERLKLLCEDMLGSSVDVSTAATTLVLAEQHACQWLKDACFRFLRSPGKVKAVMATEGSPSLLDVSKAIGDLNLECY